MKRELYGCPCCSGTFGGLFSVNNTVRNLREKATSGTGWSCNWGIDWVRLGRRDFLMTGAAVAGLSALLPSDGNAQPAVSKHTTTVFTNGKILTVDDDFSETEAIAVRGNRILAVGTNGEVRAVAGADATVIDLDGKTVLPGFIDAHTHVVSGSVVDAIMDYVGMARYSTVGEVLDHIARRAAETPAGEWLVFRNFDPAVQEGADALTFADLDPISTVHPIFVLNASGHLAYANSKAFEVSGVTNDVEDPPGGEFVRDADGNLTGTMKNNVAFLKIVENYPAMMAVNPVDGLIGLLDKWTKFGLTTVSELSLGALAQSPADAQVMAAAAQSGRMKARIRAYPFYTLGAEVWDEAGIMQGNGNALARITGYKLVADGSNQGFTGLQREPYLDSDNRGLAYMQPEELTAAALERAEKGWHLAIHGNGDAAIDNILDTCEALRDAGIDMSRVRPRIEHCSILHDEQIKRMKDLGVSASFLIGHVHFWGVAMRDEVFGEEKAQLLDRCRSVEEAGVGFTLHSDFMVTDPNPLHMIEMAVTRRTWKEPDYVLAPEETISVDSAIRAMTSEAAWQLFSDHEIGSLEPGKLADMVILDQDPRDVVPDEIKKIKVLETWMDGRQVFQA
ncbi:N-substituted formamide deformylase precursor [Phaeobacter sp. CECT 5382]|uniref:amidohydrolase n=1 Tax=Phaeobacter sp. CECT 5382 TaxID=1712645 RepID=UPI0006DAE731|nr:amidohydrolase [Phaeobacter sp. CECT 5382]CUH88526.1 N-substituted formamide deformylase precursor [Phaeobacter sp. CECT 5382]